LEECRVQATRDSEAHAGVNKARFDARFDASNTTVKLVSYAVGERVKLRNETHTKGQPHWYGPFEVFDSLGQNVYTLLDHRQSLFPHLVSGNRLKPARVKDSDMSAPWALPPSLIQEIANTDLRVSRRVVKSAAKMRQTQEKLPKIRLIGRFAPPAV
ncbi:hypothetical protein CROQUDRAFT_46070, partial [Cronartium quercuum f. sp. fusiforme G11]